MNFVYKSKLLVIIQSLLSLFFMLQLISLKDEYVRLNSF